MLVAVLVVQADANPACSTMEQMTQPWRAAMHAIQAYATHLLVPRRRPVAPQARVLHQHLERQALVARST